MSVREASKLFGGSLLVYAAVAGLPAGTPSDATCSSRSQAAIGVAAAQAESGAQLKPTYLEGTDGSRQLLGWHDTARDVDCSFATAADGTWRCLPGGAEAGRFFADATCSQPLALVPRGWWRRVATLVDTSACGWQPTTHVFALGPRFTGPILYWMAAGACGAVASSTVALHDVYAVGDEMPAWSRSWARCGGGRAVN